MRNRAYLLVALLGLLTFVLAPGLATAGQGKNLSEIALASGAAARAAAVSGPVIAVSPLGNNYGIVNIGSCSSFSFTISNTGDADLHIGSTVSSSGSFSATVGSSTVAAGGSTTMDVAYCPTAGVDESGTITINSDATNGAFSVNVSGRGNAAPVLDPIGNKSASAFVNLSFTTTASDNGDQIDDALSFSASPALPPGATYNTSTGEFSWTPGGSDAGTYSITFCASDGNASDCETITITVSSENAPPVAVAGGPYSGAAGQPVTLNGSASSDPDGDNLTYTWDFGDGQTGTGAVVSHTYAVANNYLATLTVTDDGSPSLSDSDVASVQILNAIPASLTAKFGGSAMRLEGGGTQQFGIEITARPVTDIDATTITLSTSTGGGSISEIAVDPRTVSVGDLDRDGIPELVFSVKKSDLRALVGPVAANTNVTFVVDARTTQGTGSIPVSGTGTFRVKSSGGAAVSSFASPNPFNPMTKINYTVKRDGPVMIRIYSLDGRLVKTLKDDFAAAGSHEVHWNGTDSNGRSVPSGMYFVKTEAGADKSVFKLSLLK